MEYNNKQQADITCTSNEQDNDRSTPIGMPPNILMKVSWAKKLRFLTNEDKAAVFTNIFNYYIGDALVEMNPVAEMFFATATELFDYNIGNYADVVIKNRKNGKKHVGKKEETQNNPMGFSETQNNLKEKEKDKAKEKVKLKDKEIEKIDIKIERDKFRKIAEIDFHTIPDMESKYFCYDVLELVEKLGWARFDLLMFGTGAKEVPVVLHDFNLIELEPVITKTKRSYKYYFDKLLN